MIRKRMKKVIAVVITIYGEIIKREIILVLLKREEYREIKVKKIALKLINQ